MSPRRRRRLRRRSRCVRVLGWQCTVGGIYAGFHIGYDDERATTKCSRA